MFTQIARGLLFGVIAIGLLFLLSSLPMLPKEFGMTLGSLVIIALGFGGLKLLQRKVGTPTVSTNTAQLMQAIGLILAIFGALLSIPGAIISLFFAAIVFTSESDSASYITLFQMFGASVVPGIALIFIGLRLRKSHQPNL